MGTNTHRTLRRLGGWWAVLAVALVWGAVALSNVTGRLPGGRLGRTVDSFSGGCDFMAYYAAALCVTHGHWESLYWREMYPGWRKSHDRMPEATHLCTHTPWMLETLEAHGAGHFKGRYRYEWVYPPTGAVFVAPLAVFDYIGARRAWGLMSGVALVLLLVLSKLEMDRIGTHPLLRDALLLAVGFGAPAQRALVVLNVDAVVALAVLCTLRGFRSGRLAGPTFGFLFLGLTKGTSALWAPFLPVWRKWRLVAVLAAGTALLLLLARAMGGGWDAYDAFLRGLIPYMKGTVWENPDNESLLRCLKKLGAGERTLASATALWLAGYAWIWIRNWMLFRRRGVPPASERGFRAMALSLFLSFLFFQWFTNICWSHYRLHLMAFVPMALAVSRGRPALRALFFAGLALFTFCPAKNLSLGAATIPEPLPGCLAYVLWLAFGAVAFHLTFRKGGDLPETKAPA